MKKYNIIYADPPWQYKANRRDYIANTSGEAQAHYKVMSLKQIQGLQVPKITASRCMLFVWVTLPLIQEGLDTIAAWDFLYKTVAFSWVKTTKDGTRPSFGVGYYTRSNVELCLLGVKGRAFVRDSSISSVVISPREAHSKKPDIVKDKIVQLVGALPRIELFARTKNKRLGYMGQRSYS